MQVGLVHLADCHIWSMARSSCWLRSLIRSTMLEFINSMPKLTPRRTMMTVKKIRMIVNEEVNELVRINRRTFHRRDYPSLAFLHGDRVGRASQSMLPALL